MLSFCSYLPFSPLIFFVYVMIITYSQHVTSNLKSCTFFYAYTKYGYRFTFNNRTCRFSVHIQSV